MSDTLFSAVLTFSVLAAGTVAVGSEMLAPRHPAPTRAATVATLPAVTVIGKRVAHADQVTLPLVVVTGRRSVEPTTVAIADGASKPRIQ